MTADMATTTLAISWADFWCTRAENAVLGAGPERSVELSEPGRMSVPMMHKDERAQFNEVFVPHLPEAYRLAHWPRSDAEDVVQEDYSSFAAVLLETHRNSCVLIWTVSAARLVWRHNCAYLPPFPESMPRLQQAIA